MALALGATAGVLGLFVGMLFSAEVGRRIGRARLNRDPEGLEKGAGTAEGALFALLGLMIAFTFSAAANRFDDRKQLVLQESNAIGTAWLRIDLLPADERGPLRELFRRYVDVRIATYRDVLDDYATREGLTQGAALQAQIWERAMAALRRPDTAPQATIVLVPALNEVFDITTSRLMAARNHTPLVVFLLLGALSVTGALLVGYGTSTNRDRGWFHVVVFGAILALTIYVIVDLEFPRVGLIRVDDADLLLLELREGMN